MVVKLVHEFHGSRRAEDVVHVHVGDRISFLQQQVQVGIVESAKEFRPPNPRLAGCVVEWLHQLALVAGKNEFIHLASIPCGVLDYRDRLLISLRIDRVDQRRLGGFGHSDNRGGEQECEENLKVTLFFHKVIIAGSVAEKPFRHRVVKSHGKA